MNLTRAGIRRLKACRHTDRLVNKEVMYGSGQGDCPRHSSEHLKGFDVLIALGCHGVRWALWVEPDHRICCTLIWGKNEEHETSAIGATVPLVICGAALLRVLEIQEQQRAACN